MSNLIITIISVALFALLMWSGSGYINIDQYQRHEDAALIKTSLLVMSTASASYQMMNRQPAESIADIVPDFTGLPALPTGLNWDSLSNENGTHVWCFGGSVNSTTYQSLGDLQGKIGSTKFVIGESCGDTSDASAPGNYPATVMVTYRN